jgi:hypothetical protein
MVRISRGSGFEWRTRWRRTALGALLLIIALVWPFAEIGPSGPELLQISGNHGIDVYDLVALIPFFLAIFLLVPLFCGSEHRRATARNDDRPG